MRSAFSSLRFRALAMLGLTFSVILIALAYFVLTQREERLADAMVRLQANAEGIAGKQHRVIDYAQQFLSMMLEIRDLREFGPTPHCQKLLAGLLARNAPLANIAIADLNGDLICNSIATDGPINIADRQYFQGALATTDVVISEAIVSRSTGKFGLPLAKAIRNESGQVKSVVVVLLDLQWLNNELGGANYPEGARIGLVDIRGLVLARYPDKGTWVGRNASDTPFFKALNAHGSSGTFQALGFDMVPRLYGIARFADTTAGPIFLWVGTPVDSVVGAINRELSGTLLVVLTVVALTFMATWFWGERLLLRPVSAMSAAAQRLGRGDYVARTGLSHGDDEMGELARSFDAMAAALMSKSEILRLNRALRTLSKCNGALIHAETESGLLNEICRIIVETGDYRLAWVGFAEHDEGKTVRPVAQHGYETGYLDKALITWADVERGRGPTGTAIRTGLPQFNQNFLTDPLLAPWRDEALKRGFQSSAALPLKDGSAAFGALMIYAHDPDTFTEDEQKLMTELANDLAFGIVTLRAGAMHRQAQARLHRSMVATIHAMAATLETRDPYTAGHQRRVAELAVAIARELGFPEEEIQGIHLAGIVHDLGKISVPAEILSKPGRLTDLEYQIVKTHVQAGYDILKGIDFPWPIANLVLQHHERLDGSGYPHGLKDKEIMPGARILAVADTVEPMASHRPYRPGLGIAAALKEIAKNRGTLYDAAVVDACEKLFKEKGYKLSSQGGLQDRLNAIVDVPSS